jgi:hypothetical protein
MAQVDCDEIRISGTDQLGDVAGIEWALVDTCRVLYG